MHDAPHACMSLVEVRDKTGKPVPQFLAGGLKNSNYTRLPNTQMEKHEKAKEAMTFLHMMSACGVSLHHT